MQFIYSKCVNNQALVIMMVGQLRAEGWAICHWKELLHSPSLKFQASVL